jgi:hypothetical protein
VKTDLLRAVLYGLSLIPPAFLGALYTFATVATIKLGHYPRCSADDPKYLGLDLFYHMVWPLGALMFYSAPLWLLLWLYALIKQPTWRRKALFYSLGWVLVLVQLVFDPLNTLCWYAD